MQFKKLFEPIGIGKLLIKNRIAMAPMGTFGLVDPEGSLTPRAIDYYAERAYGGVGLIITGVARVTELEPRFGRFFVSPRTLPSLGELAESVHYFGARIFVQLTAGVGRVLAGSLIDRGAGPVSASVVPSYWRPNVTTRELTTEEVEQLVTSLGHSAELLKTAGVDGVELHGHQGYLFDQFTTAIWNKRNDKYGGSLEARLRFPVEVLNAIKNRVGKDFPVTYRYGLKHFMDGPETGTIKYDHLEVGRDIEEGLEMARLLEEAGFDALHIDAGCYESLYWPFPPIYQPHGCIAYLAAEVKKVVAIPVIVVGRLDIPELAERIISEGKADIIALGRALLADPEWPKKVYKNQKEEIRPCIGCNDGCLYRTSVESKPLSCAVNPATGKERSDAVRVLRNHSKRVLIAGGGVAGMEAARVATLRGSQVTLYEKSERLGGHLIEASVPDFKHDIRRLLDWYVRQLEKLGVEIKCRTEATPALIENENPNKILVATGSTPIVPDLRGINNRSVATCVDLLLSRKESGENVLVIGGGLVGCETALWLAHQGKKVSIVEALPELALDIHPSNKTMLIEMLRDKGVLCLTCTSLQEVTDDGVILINSGFHQEVQCDTVALALGLKPNTLLYESLRDKFIETYLIGDCKEPRRILHAIWDGYHIA
jgi:2-enoate reductase